MEHNTIRNSMHTKEECPLCHHAFIGGFDPSNHRRCPSCKHKFVSGATIDHGNGCSICTGRNNSKPKYKGMSNTHYENGCPALMSDGRFITYYNSSNELTDSMRKLNGFRSPNEFRAFMQKNGKLFMDAERKYLEKENTCKPDTACSQGWYDLWTSKQGNWSN